MGRKVNKLSQAFKELQLNKTNEASNNTEKLETPAGTVLCKPFAQGEWPKSKNKVPPVFLHVSLLEPNILKQVGEFIKKNELNVQSFKGYRNYYKAAVVTPSDHKALVAYCDKNKIPYHTFGPTSKRKLRVVVRGLPKDTDLAKVKQELQELNIPVIRLHAMHTTKGLERPLFLLVIVPHTSAGRKILLLKKILGYEINLEPPDKKSKQCHRCQKWGHAQRYCHGKVKCVRCAGEHFSKKCPINLTDPPKCANCEGNHTANYKECPACPDSEEHKRGHAMNVASRNSGPELALNMF